MESRAGDAGRHVIGQVDDVEGRVLHDVGQGGRGFVALPEQVQRYAARIEAGIGGRADIADRSIGARDRIQRRIEVRGVDAVVGFDVVQPLAVAERGIPAEPIVEDLAFQSKGGGDDRRPGVGPLHVDEIHRQGGQGEGRGFGQGPVGGQQGLNIGREIGISADDRR